LHETVTEISDSSDVFIAGSILQIIIRIWESF